MWVVVGPGCCCTGRDVVTGSGGPAIDLRGFRGRVRLATGVVRFVRYGQLEFLGQRPGRVLVRDVGVVLGPGGERVYGVSR